MSEPLLSAADVRFLASHGRLPISEDRAAAVAPAFSALISAANELNARVAAAAGNPPSLPPIIGFPER